MQASKTAILIFLILFLGFANSSSADPTFDLHKSILASLDTGNYDETIRLLNKLKQDDPTRYGQLPYALLHAHTLALANNFKDAYSVYESVVADPRLAPFVLLPLARIAAQQGVANTAAQHYQEYLSHPYPEYNSVAREALDYCYQIKRADLLYATAQVVQKKSTFGRFAQLYLARSYILSGDRELARNLLLTLIVYYKKDDVTNLALSDLDLLEGTQISSYEKQRRGKLAYDVWNFDLARKYLEPVANQSLENGCYYARTLYFLGDSAGSRKTFEQALGSSSNEDPKYQSCLYQYANASFRDGDYAKASELYKQLKALAKGELQDTAAFKLIYAYRAQSRFQDALTTVSPFTRAKSMKIRGEALSLRARIYFQMGRFQDAYSDFQSVLLLRTYRNNRELMLWKALTLEKLRRASEARTIFSSLANGLDVYAQLAQDRISPAHSSNIGGSTGMRMPQLPDVSQENQMISMYSAGDAVPALLYLHLYDEAFQQLPDFRHETWNILGVTETNRMQKFLAVAFLANLGRNYSTGTYYSELFIKNIPRGVSILSYSPDVLKALFPLPYKNEVERYAKERNLDPFLILSIMRQESKFKTFARSQTFARGLMQIIPSTATKLATALNLQNFSLDQLYRPEVSINLGTRYVQDIVREFGDQLELIAAGYNSGEENVRRWRDCSMTGDTLDFVSSIDFNETKTYVSIVKTNYELYKRTYGGSFNSGQTESSSKH